MTIRYLIAVAVLTVPGSVCIAHPGRTDANGGHTDRRTGSYHTHGGGGGGGGGSLYSAPSPGHIGLRSYTYTPRTRPPKLRQKEVRTTFRGTPDDEKSARLVNFAKRQYDLGNINKATKYVWLVLDKYGESKAASEAKLLLEGWIASMEFREWKDATGKFSVVARFVYRDGNTVYFQDQSGKTIKVEFERLSLPDQKYIQEREQSG